MLYKYLFITVIVISCLKMSTGDFASDLAALIKKQNADILKRNMELAFSGDGAFASSSPNGNVVTTTQNGKKTTVGSKGPVAGAFGNAISMASDGLGTVLALGN